MTGSIKISLLRLFTFVSLFAVNRHMQAQVNFTTSKLPIVLINTYGNNIVDDPKVLSHIAIINNTSGVNNITDPPNDLNAEMGVEIRGSSSQMFPKKSLGIELWTNGSTVANHTALDTNVLGMPKQSDWILYGPYTDKTMSRDVLSHAMFRQMGHYAPRCRFVELVVNGTYGGVYVMMEKIKRDDSRVNIAKLEANDTANNAVTGGYLLKIDKTTGSFAQSFTNYCTGLCASLYGTKSYQYQVAYPQDINAKQMQYISNYVSKFENALMSNNFRDPINGYRKYMFELSFIDFLLIQELSHNVDGYRLSTYLYKDKDTNANGNEGKLIMGPTWDFNLGYGNADYCDGWRTDSWAYDIGLSNCGNVDEQVPFWWKRMLEDTLFTNHLKCRYTSLRSGLLSNSNIYHMLDSMVNVIGVNALNREETMWPKLGTYVWPNSWTPPTYQNEIDSMKNWLSRRLVWLDNNIPGKLNGCTAFLNQSDLPKETYCKLYPNPVANILNIEIVVDNATPLHCTIIDMLGRPISQTHHNVAPVYNTINLQLPQTMAAGSYSILLTQNGQLLSRKLFSKQ